MDCNGVVVWSSQTHPEDTGGRIGFGIELLDLESDAAELLVGLLEEPRV